MIIRRPHNPLGVIATAATVHLAAAVPNFASMEIRASPSEDYGFYDRDLFPVQMEQDGPRMRVPTRPGLGVELNEELGGSPGGRLPADFRPIATRHLRRPDGSIANWQGWQGPVAAPAPLSASILAPGCRVARGDPDDRHREPGIGTAAGGPSLRGRAARPGHPGPG